MNHGTHGNEHGGNRWDGGNFPRVTEPLSETFAPQRDLDMTLRFLSFSVYSVCSVVQHSGLENDIPTPWKAEVHDPEHWVGESISVVFAPRKPCPRGLRNENLRKMATTLLRKSDRSAHVLANVATE